MDVRLIVDEPAGGSWNMSFDEALLETAASQQIGTLRFYQWSEPTLSLGYFQSCDERLTHPASRNCATVRRASGGGAILHHHELTYSFAIPTADRLAADVEQLYYAFHETLIEVLRSQNVLAALCQNPQRIPREAESFLCFQRRSSGDVLLADNKICGSAQRRHQGAVLQHGSLLLKSSPYAPELLGISEISGVVINITDFVPLWTRKLVERLNVNISSCDSFTADLELSKCIESIKFGNEAWNKKR